MNPIKKIAKAAIGGSLFGGVRTLDAVSSILKKPFKNSAAAKREAAVKKITAKQLLDDIDNAKTSKDLLKAVKKMNIKRKTLSIIFFSLLLFVFSSCSLLDVFKSTPTHSDMIEQMFLLNSNCVVNFIYFDYHADLIGLSEREVSYRSCVDQLLICYTKEGQASLEKHIKLLGGE